MGTARLRPPPDDARHENEKCSHEEGIDADKGDQCRKQRMRWYRRNSVDGFQQAEDDPGLTSGLGQIPSAESRDNTRGRHDHQTVEEPSRYEEPAFPSKPQRGYRYGEHQDGNTVHNSQSVKGHSH